MNKFTGEAILFLGKTTLDRRNKLTPTLNDLKAFSWCDMLHQSDSCIFKEHLASKVARAGKRGLDISLDIFKNYATLQPIRLTGMQSSNSNLASKEYGKGKW